MNYALSLVTPPAGEPVSLVEAKQFLHIDAVNDDTLLTALVTAARRQFDGKDAWFGRALMTQTWDLQLAHFPCTPDRPYDSDYGIQVPLPPLQTVLSVSYVDAAGVPQVLDPMTYIVDSKSEPGRITPAYSQVWPATRSVPNAVTVRYIAGYGNAQAVPEEIKTWIKQAAAYLYANREAIALPQAFFWSMANYRRSWTF